MYIASLKLAMFSNGISAWAEQSYVISAAGEVTGIVIPGHGVWKTVPI